jgi:hypothetical protein
LVLLFLFFLLCSKASVSVVESGLCATWVVFAALLRKLSGSGGVSSSEFSVSSNSVSGVSMVCQV